MVTTLYFSSHLPGFSQAEPRFSREPAPEDIQSAESLIGFAWHVPVASRWAPQIARTATSIPTNGRKLKRSDETSRWRVPS